MYDMHYDLLTILYFNMVKNNKFANKEKLIYDLKQIYQDNNVLGGIINLYFMTPEEMNEELDISLQEMSNIRNMFLKSIGFLNTMKKQGIIPYNKNFIYSIEGCDYIQTEKDLEGLYELGLRSIIPVWNHRNQYGSGNRTEAGLTKKGISLIKKAIDLGIIIDVSHANMNTFNDILDVYSDNRKEDSIIMASHSNIRSLCDRDRNLTDFQIQRLKDSNGYIGLFTNGNFLLNNNENATYVERQNNFLKHLDYLINTMKFPIDKILLSTDDMNFNPDKSYHHLEAFPIETISRDIFRKIYDRYGYDVANKIIRENAEYIVNKVKKKG